MTAPAAARRLALFDLDHTLIPFDSGMAWTRHLCAEGVLPPDAPAAYLALCHRYVAGTVDVATMHRETVAPLAALERARFDALGARFEAAIAPRLPVAMRALVQRHLQAGDLCAIVTATTRFVATPIARAFGIPHVVATEPVLDARGVPTGELVGPPCHGVHKPAHVAAWLARLGHALDDFAERWAYSDAIADLPLLVLATHPVAVAPEAALAAHAARQGWRVIEPQRARQAG